MSIWRRVGVAPGIYDEVVTARVREELEARAGDLVPFLEVLGKSSDVTLPLVSVLREAFEAALDDVGGRPEEALALADDVLALLARRAPGAIRRPEEWRFDARRLRAVMPRSGLEPERPRGPLHRSSLIANAEGEQLLDHLRSEFDSADRVELLCAFVKLSGVEKLRERLERLCVARGRPLRVLTTTYMGASDAKAIEHLAALPNVEVKVSYDEQVTRLHAKAWLFHRESGLSTAYVGSSNLSHAAQTEGLEWNIRVAESDQPALVEQIRETFAQYWEDAHQFERFDPKLETDRHRLRRALSPSRHESAAGVMPDIEPKPFQKPVLEELAAARALGRHRNLLVAATGTGKTFMAAFDYRRLREEKRVDTLLFVAHRREILQQAQTTFRLALQLQSFGELLDQYERPVVGRHVFASIASLGSQRSDDASIDPAAFDMVILDEAHHASADSWDALLQRVRPKELLGLTGTPERADGLDYETHFPRPWIGNLRLWNAIPHALVPFRYYMLDVEGVDLRKVEWLPRRGAYSPAALSENLVRASDAFVLRAARALMEHIGRPDELRALAFCCDRGHAEVVAERLARHGYRTKVLTADTPHHERRDAQGELDRGEVQVLCVVDLYNEGVDVPNVNTLLFFRPTESATVFLQQLGRGLRRARDKAELVVFDLTGRQHHQFRFDRRLRAMLGHTARELRELVKQGQGRLPSGCHLHFDEVARRDVLEQLERSVPTDVRGIRELLRDPAHANLELRAFLHETDVALEDLYGSRYSWTELRRSVGLERRPLSEREDLALGNLHKVLHVGDATRLGVWRRLLKLEAPTTARDARIAAMLFGVLYDKSLGVDLKAWPAWCSHALLREELEQLIPVLGERNAMLAPSHELGSEIPLTLHARYRGVELSAAFDQRSEKGDLRDYYTGVERTGHDAAGHGLFDMLLVTLEKAASRKEHLKYRDFPLSEHRFHWQSKARTRRDSLEGRRHLDPEGERCTPLLFVREREDERPGVTAPFVYLGPVIPDGDHGERPITIEWKLRFPMPPGLARRGRVAA